MVINKWHISLTIIMMSSMEYDLVCVFIIMSYPCLEIININNNNNMVVWQTNTE